MSVVDIVEFLTARLDEDQAAAEAAGVTRSGKTASWRVDCDCPGIHVHDCYERRVEGDNITIYDEGGHDEDQARHIARWDPLRVLAEVAAKRAILALHEYGGNARHPDTDSKIPVCAVCESPPLYNTPPWPTEVFLDTDGDASMWPCLTLRHLAGAYADHPDYNPAWRVE